MPRRTRIWYASDRLFNIAVAVPFVILFLLTTVPLLYSFRNSLHRFIVYEQHETFIGMLNYVNLFTSSDFFNSVYVTFIQVGATLLLQLVIGLIYALLLARKDLCIGNFSRRVFILPMMITPVIVALTWRLLFHTELGMINYFLSLVGILGPNWLGSTSWALPAVIITDLWMSTPFMTVILLAGLQSLPLEPYDAALVDGATRVQTLFLVTLPLLRPTIMVALLFRSMDAFRRFETIYTLTAGGPGRATETLNLYAYLSGFEFLDVGVASAVAFSMTAFMVILSLIVLRSMEKETGIE
jgi:multiple sugar transport system permease protein